MKIAVPNHEGRVSPVFDTCQSVMIFERGDDGAITQQAVELADVEGLRRAERLRDIGVRVLLCGGITRPQAEWVQATGIELVPWLAGDVDRIAEAYWQGALPSAEFVMPGCGAGGGRGCGRRRRQRGCGRWSNGTV